MSWRVGVAGSPVNHSLSPLLQQRAMEFLGIDGGTSRLDTSSPEALTEFLWAGDDSALSITTPLKESAVAVCDVIDDMSQRVRAVNSLRRVGSHIHGRNVDGEGLVRAIESLTGDSAESRRVCVVGGGGAARSVVAALLDSGADVTILTRRTIPQETWNSGAHLAVGTQVPECTQWLINATTSTLSGEDVEAQWGDCEPGFAMDLSYGRDSQFLERSRQLGWRVSDGLAMLICQAQLQFEWWWGEVVPLEVLGWSS
jgi:shikimate dehydrogenase